jgi:hypothetical protein
MGIRGLSRRLWFLIRELFPHKKFAIKNSSEGQSLPINKISFSIIPLTIPFPLEDRLQIQWENILLWRFLF